MDNTFENELLNVRNQLLDSIRNEDIQRVREICDACDAKGIDLNNVKDTLGYSLLIRPCVYNRPLILRELLKRGVNVNATDKDGGTALHTAVFNGFVDCVKVLLEFGADITITQQYEDKPYTARDYAVDNKDDRILALLDEYEEFTDPLLVKEAVYE